jgi:beta-lactam-binding protein with PASTA domain
MGRVTSMPPPWEPDDEETQETRILPPEEQTRIAPPTPPVAEERTWVVEEEPPPPVPPPGGPSRRDPWPWVLLGLGLALALIAAIWFFTRDDGSDETATKPVPSVVRLQENDARQALEAQGFVVNAVPKPSDEADEGVVFAQDPSGGADAAEGSVVTISVSSGPATVEVPDVVGASQQAATQQLDQASLVARPSTVPSSQPQGTVVAQSPSAGEKVERDSPVRINVSGGPGTATVPDVRGSSVDDATAELQAAGLGVQTSEVESDEAEGTVVSQSPAAGAKVDRGTRVSLSVSKGPSVQPVEVPDVAGFTQDEAQAQLEELGLRVRVVDETAPDPAQVGTVLRQVPPAGRSVPPGTQVTIVVAT